MTRMGSSALTPSFGRRHRPNGNRTIRSLKRCAPMLAEALTAKFRIEHTHPALQGHFPDNPIVPAVLLVGFVAETLVRAGKQLRGLPRMKFLRPVRAAECIEVKVRQLQSATGAIEVEIDGELVAKGEWLS